MEADQGLIAPRKRFGLIYKHSAQKMALEITSNQPLAPVELLDWGTLASGKSGWLDIEIALLRAAQELFGIFCQKQHDYGPTSIAVGGLKGIAVRMVDKTSRLWELTGVAALSTDKEEKSENAVTGESIRDTLLDQADYGIIGVLVYDKHWPLITPAEVWGTQALHKLLDGDGK